MRIGGGEVLQGKLKGDNRMKSFKTPGASESTVWHSWRKIIGI